MTKIKLKILHIGAWVTTILLISVILFQIWYTYDQWEYFGKLGRLLYISFQTLVLFYAACNVVAIWGNYTVEKYLYERDNENKLE